MPILVKRESIQLKDHIDKNLSLRSLADMLFDYINSLDDIDIIIDFDSVNSMSRSFAQQFIERMENSRNHITCTNEPENIKKMFNTVRHPKKKTMIAKPQKAIIL